MFRQSLSLDEGLLLMMPRESRLDSSIHMLFVYFDLAVIWISATMEVVDKIRAESWHPAYFPAQPARYVLELHPDLLPEYEIGHKVEFVDA